MSAASDVKQLPPAEGDDELSKSSAIVLANNNNTGALDIILAPESVSILDVLDIDKEVLSLTSTNPAKVLNAIIIEENFEERNKNGYITKSTGEEVFHSSCKNLASKVIRNTEKIKPLFFGQLVEGDGEQVKFVRTRILLN